MALNSNHSAESTDMASIGEVLAALSKALDMVEGQPPGHAVRTARIAVKICEKIGCPQRTISNAYFASLLKDSGCSNNSSRIHHIFGGDDFLNKREVKFIDWSSPIESLKFAFSHVERGESIQKKLTKLLGMLGKPSDIMDEVTAARCTRGSMIALSLGFDFEVASAVQALDEHWDGKGSPSKLERDRIPLLARVLCVAQTLEIFVTSFGVENAFEMVKNRSGRWFDPAIAQATLSLQNDHWFWAAHFSNIAGRIDDYQVDIEAVEGPKTDIDSVCEAFANIVDAKSSFTAEHSTRVTEYAVKLGEYFAFDPVRLQTLKRASLLHDVGKLGVSNAILEKPGKLTDEEFDQVKLHPKNSYKILSQIRGMERITDIASAHHERLDGRGYWKGLNADQLDLDMRILTASDVFDALSAKRPYRDALPTKQVFEIMDKDTGTAFDPECVVALKEMYGNEDFVGQAGEKAA